MTRETCLKDRGHKWLKKHEYGEIRFIFGGRLAHNSTYKCIIGMTPYSPYDSIVSFWQKNTFGVCIETYAATFGKIKRPTLQSMRWALRTVIVEDTGIIVVWNIMYGELANSASFSLYLGALATLLCVGISLNRFPICWRAWSWGKLQRMCTLENIHITLKAAYVREVG